MMACSLCGQDEPLIKDHDYCVKCWEVAIMMATLGTDFRDREVIRDRIKKVRARSIEYANKRKAGAPLVVQEPERNDIASIIGRNLFLAMGVVMAGIIIVIACIVIITILGMT